MRAGAGTLDARANAATLELYALESELRRAQGDLDALAARRTQVAQDRAAAAKQLGIAKQAVRVSESQLAVLVRALYERPDQGDPLAVLLSADSLDEALAGLDSLSRAAGQNNRIIEQAREARTQLARARRAARGTGSGAGRSRRCGGAARRTARRDRSCAPQLRRGASGISRD